MDSQPSTTSLAVVFVALIAAMSPMAAMADPGEDSVTVRPDSPINSQETLETFQVEGAASAPATSPNLTVTIGSEREDVGLSYTVNPLESSTRNDFVRVEYREDIARTVRIPIRSDYWEPYPRDAIQSLSGNRTATFEPVEMNGEEYTMVSISFDHSGSATFPVPEDAVAVYSAAERTEETANSTFGVKLGLTASPWKEVPPEIFTENQTSVRIEGNPNTMMIQYNTGTPSDPNWVPVPNAQRGNVPVYRMTQDGVDNAVYVVSLTSDPPDVRYKLETTWADKVNGWVAGAKDIPTRLGESLGGVDVPFLHSGVA